MNEGARRSCALTLACALTACAPTGGGETSATTDAPSSGEVSVDTSSSASATGDATDSTGAATDVSATADATGSTSDASATDSGTGTTDPAAQCVDGECDLEACACALLPEDVERLDCGYLYVQDPAPLWQAAHDCALAAADQQQAFKLVYELQGIDSFVGRALTGHSSGGYVLQELRYDSWGAPIAGTNTCETIAALPNCDVDSNSMCLECVNPGAATTLCDGP